MIEDMSLPAQNYANHAQRVPVFLGMLIVLLLTLIGSGVNMYKSWDDHQRMYSASLVLALSVCALIGGVYSRTFALKAQDRAIRAEENLRHFAMTGKLIDPRLETLQIVALRFAPDDEFLQLARKAAEEGTTPKDIKQAIKNWRPDHYRA